MFQLNRFIAESVTGRPQSMFLADMEAHRVRLSGEIENRSVLVIGGAGTIGGSFIRSLLPFRPASLVVVDVNENGLAELTRDLRSSGGFVPDDYLTYPMSYADPVFEKMFLSRGGFDIVANFSAHKHVRSEKDVFAVEALLRNNVMNARGLLELLVRHKPKRFFCVSTDKAANPVNIMGASKKLMEEMAMVYAEDFPVTTARFANVAFSNGSLPAAFLERIAKGQPLSAPSDVTRYFVSPEESGQICLLACVLGRPGEIFFPKLSREQVMTFSEIARRLLAALGYEPLECRSEQEAVEKARALAEGSKCYPVRFTRSDTTGEKSFEEFHTENESVDMERYHGLGVVLPGSRRSKSEIDRLFSRLESSFGDPGGGKEKVVRILQEFLGNFDHLETGRNLDSKM